MESTKKYSDFLHPALAFDSLNWRKWRLTYKGGTDFIQEYLKPLSIRESTEEFNERKEITYVPAFAKAAINDIKNAIFQRTSDVVRKQGPSSYLRACVGLDGGVDFRGATMNNFIGRYILPELLTMRRVGIFVDMPPLKGSTVTDNLGLRPYIYMYQTEDIISWQFEGPDQPNEYKALLLRDHDYTTDEDTDLVVSRGERYRLLWKENGKVKCKFCDDNGDNERIIDLNLTRIPFHVFEIPSSLLEDVADYQIALMNIASSDISYIRKANYPFYVEQYDHRTEMLHTKGPPVADGTAPTTNKARQPEIATGVGQGRRVPSGMEMPKFIHPSSEPIKASMEKQEALKKDIKELVNLAVSNLNASAESKQQDNQGLEAGLSFIGLVLEHGEHQIASYWAGYESSESATVTYPTNYSLKSEEDRQREAEGDELLMSKLPSDTFKREMSKEIARKKLGGKVPQTVLDKIYSELNTAPAIVSDPDQIHQDWEDGLVSTDTASKLRGYKDGETEQAKKDHAERLAAILEAQGGESGQARGTKDFSSSKGEKVNKPQRGEGKNIDGKRNRE